MEFPWYAGGGGGGGGVFRHLGDEANLSYLENERT